MPIPAPYLLGLQMYEIDDEALALRAEVWRYLGPMMDTICDRHFAKILKFTPFYEESLKESAAEWRWLVIHYTSRLFLEPFDEKFAEDALERVEIEIGLAADMRTRGTIAQSILTNFSRELQRRFWLSRRKALQLTDVAQRVLTLDAANAIVLHYTARVGAAKKRGTELSGAIKDFDEAVKSVRSLVSDAVQSFSDNAAKLSCLAGSASEESSVATEAALNTATNASTIAAAVERLSSSLGSISGRAVDGARVGETAVARAVQTNDTNSPRLSNGSRTTSTIRHTRLRTSPRKRPKPRKTPAPSRKHWQRSGKRSAKRDVLLTSLSKSPSLCRAARRQSVTRSIGCSNLRLGTRPSKLFPTWDELQASNGARA
jgi:hypothetical protein